MKQIKPNVALWRSSVQKEKQLEVILTRLRIGHTRMTHEYLMSTPRVDIPRCGPCNAVLSVKHILCECRMFDIQRDLYLKNEPLTNILADSDKFNLYRLLNFLRKTNLINKI